MLSPFTATFQNMVLVPECHKIIYQTQLSSLSKRNLCSKAQSLRLISHEHIGQRQEAEGLELQVTKPP